MTKVSENVTEQINVEVTEQVTNVTVLEGIPSGVKVKREPFKASMAKNKDIQYYSYFVSGKVLKNGVVKELKANMVPQDKGGFGVLDLIFDDNNEADLYLIPYSMFDERTNQRTSGYTYEAISIFDDIVYRLKLRPYKPSDKAYLDIILQLSKMKGAR